jgi:alkylation response protein AidB-like acyl-CoA dehydrogenase
LLAIIGAMSMDFLQTPPALRHPLESDRSLRLFLGRLPAEVKAAIAPGLYRLGERAIKEMPALAAAAEAQPPRHVPFDAWGRRVDTIEVSEAWKRLHAIAAEEGIVATAFERREGEHSRVHQMLRLYLYHPSSAIASCPMAMTDGAARVLELQGSPELRERVLPRLLSRDPASFWTSGQWMTEKTGGSDVSGTSTVAYPAEDGSFRLFGIKWFTSATTAEVALALARPEGAADGSRGLSLFLVELRDEAGALRGVRIERLKDKLGTRALPTAELQLEGAHAWQVGPAGRGVATVATLLNITRLYNSVCAVGSLRRGLDLAWDYAEKRVAFGRPLAEQPLHLRTLAELEIEHGGAFLLTFRAGELLGREEVGLATDEERLLLRLLTPLAKLETARQAVAGASEILEAFGGAGYVEDTGLPRILRDVQVLAIWEGTTNVLALDALRAIEKEGALPALAAEVERCLGQEGVPAELAQRVKAAQQSIAAEGGRRFAEGRAEVEASARAYARSLARLAMAALLCEQAAGGDPVALALAEGFVPTLERAVESLRAFPPGLAESLRPY